jgi:hypothetical protein
LTWAPLVIALLGASAAQAVTTAGSSEAITWSCTGSNCPWGTSPFSDPALVWPSTLDAIGNRLGYSTSKPVYLPANLANGATIWIDSGWAVAYAGQPNAGSHRVLATIDVGGFYTVSGLAADEVLSVQSGGSFSYTIDVPGPMTPPEDPEDPQDPPPAGDASSLITWNCTGAPCPWGNSLTGQALVWPADAQPINVRFGYTTSGGVYLPSGRANGAIITVTSGSASLFAGAPNAGSHRVLAEIGVGQSYEVTGLAAEEVLSVQADFAFAYQISLPPPSEDPPPEDPPPNDPPPGTPSTLVTWDCTSTPCPWGSSLTGHALVWPAEADANTVRFGYTTSHGIYLRGNRANGTQVTVDTGTASVFAGAPGAGSHRLLATLSAGQSYTAAGIAQAEGLSVQADDPFTYHATVGPLVSLPEGAYKSVYALWQCNIEHCSGPPWTGAVIDWPSWAAYQSNGRSGNESRSVFTAEGTPLYPYMGSWANGCKVTARTGNVLIIEWERGRENWREIWLNPGESHTITLTAPENNAMIEAEDNSPGFTVDLENCTPQPLP